MDIQLLKKHFQKLGATLKTSDWQPANRWQVRPPGNTYSLDVVEGKNEHYLLMVSGKSPDFQVLELDAKRRHLLLMVRPEDGEKEKFLCGHDERHWFAASVANGGVRNINTAMDSLKPELVRQAESQVVLKPKKTE